MKRIIAMACSVLVVLSAGCSKEFDDSALVGRMDNLESRVSALEALCKQMNTNISSLQTIVDVLQNADYITSVTPVTQNGVTIGYTITFAKNGSITIYHGTDGKDGTNGKDGTDGKDGYTPVIGVRQDADGLYYWTLDGEWLLDASGNKICAAGRDGRDGVDGKDGKDGADGRDGKDGITPQLKIEDGYWYVSYDNGATWIQLGKATGEDGKDGTNGKDGADGKDGVDGQPGRDGLPGQPGADGDSMFRDVTHDELNVYLTLADGTVITIPKGWPLSIAFDEEDLVVMSPNSTREIHYTVSSIIDVDIDVVSSADIKAKVVAASALTGTIEVKTGAMIDEYSKVVVFVSNGEKVIMRRILFEQTGLQVEDNATKGAAAEGGELVLEFMSNVECEVVIPESAQSWISVVPQTRAMEKRSITLKLEPNDGHHRSATVTVQSTDGSVKLEYLVEQKGELGVDIDPEAVPDNEIWIVTDEIGEIELLNTDSFDANLVSKQYKGGKWVFRFDKELKRMNWPAGVWNSSSIIELYFPNTMEYIVLDDTWIRSLKELYVPKNVRYFSITQESNIAKFYGHNISEDGRCIVINKKIYAFAPGGIEEYTIPNGITTVGQYAFKSSELKKITIPEGVEILEHDAFVRCPNIEYVNLPSSLNTIGGYAFRSAKLKKFNGNCRYISKDGYSLITGNMLVNFASGAGLTSYEIPEGVELIDSYSFYYAENLKEVTFPQSLQALASAYCFEGTYNIEKIYGPNVLSDNRSLVIDNTLIYVAPKGLTHYKTPAGVTRLGYYSLACKPEMESVVISDEVELVANTYFPYGYILQENHNLKTVTISANMKILAMDPFGSGASGSPNDVCRNIESVYLRAPIPPVILHNFPELIPSLFPNLTIYVPEESLTLYKSSPYWIPYVNYIEGYNYTDLPEIDSNIYISTDYSQNGKVVTLQKATKGNGIDVVLMGDAYSDRQIADGTYMKAMQTMADNLFSEEPYKSFKELFNVYVVNVVSATEGYEYGNTALSGYFGGGTLVGGDDNACFSYALNAISEERMDEALIVVAMNEDAYAGTCFMYYPTTVTGTYGSGPSVAYFPTSSDTATLSGLVLHEAGGHGFSKLADEYDYGTTVSAEEVNATKVQQNDWGWWKNVDFTGDPSAVRWNYFISDYRYANEGLGVFEGGLTHSFGVWRPTNNSIMRYNTGGFNAPSREAIYYRIHKLAYGDSWQYDYEEFVKYDEINRKTAAPARVYAPATYRTTHPPVVVKKSWRDAK